MPKKSLEKIIMDKINKTIENTTKIIAEETENAYKCAIREFYSDKAFNHDGELTNVPRSYKRTYSTYTAYNGKGIGAENNVEKFGEDSFITNFIVSPDYIAGNPYRARDKNWVFLRTFELGIHGFHKGDDFLDKMNKNYLNNISAKTYLTMKGKSKNGKIKLIRGPKPFIAANGSLSYNHNDKNIPRKMDSHNRRTPKTLLDREMKNIIRGGSSNLTGNSITPIPSKYKSIGEIFNDELSKIR